MGYKNWKPEIEAEIKSRLIGGETPRQISNDLNISRSNIKDYYENYININDEEAKIQAENKQILDSIIENNQIIPYKDEYLMPLWRGFLKQNEAITMKHAYSSPNQHYYVNTCAPTWAKEIVKERWKAQTPFNLLDKKDKIALGMVVMDIRNYGKIQQKETK